MSGESGFAGAQCGPRAVRHLQLVQAVRDVIEDGVEAQCQPIGDIGGATSHSARPTNAC